MKISPVYQISVAFGVLKNLEAVRVLLKAVRVLLRAVRVLLKAVRVLVKALRVHEKP